MYKRQVKIRSSKRPRDSLRVVIDDRSRDPTGDLSALHRLAVDVEEGRLDAHGMTRRVDRHPQRDRLDQQLAVGRDIRATLGPGGTGAATPRRHGHHLFVARPATAVGDANGRASNHPRVGRFESGLLPVIGRHVLEDSGNAVETKHATGVEMCIRDRPLSVMTSSPLANLADQTAELLATIAGLANIDQLREAEPSITGKRSILSALQKSFGVLAPEDRKEAGAQLQETRRVVEAALDALHGGAETILLANGTRRHRCV